MGPVHVKSEAHGASVWLPFLTAGVAVLGFWAVVVQLRRGRQAARDERTVALSERYWTPEFQDGVSPSVSFLRVRSAGECIRKLEAYHRRGHASEKCLPREPDRPHGPKASINDIDRMMYFFEDFAASYNRNALSRRLVHETFPAPPLQLFTEGWWYVCWQRGNRWPGRQPWRRLPEWAVRRIPRDTDLWAQFEWMCLKLRKRVPSERETDWPHEQRWLLYLPPEEKSQDATLWPRALEVSKELSSYQERDLRPLVAKLEAAASGKDAHWPGWSVQIVPPSIEETKAEAQCRAWHAEKLEACLPRLAQDDVAQAVARV